MHPVISHLHSDVNYDARINQYDEFPYVFSSLAGLFNMFFWIELEKSERKGNGSKKRVGLAKWRRKTFEKWLWILDM